MYLSLLTATALTLVAGVSSAPTLTQTGAEVASAQEKTMYSKATVNIREYPNTDAEVVGTLNFADNIVVVDQIGDWYVTKYKDEFAYVNSDYLLETIPEYKTHIKKEYVGYAMQVAEKFDNMDAALIIAIIETESDGNPRCHSRTDDRGLMQVTPKWYKAEMALYGVNDLFDPYGNIQVGTHIISGLISKYGDVRTALMCYNEGEYGGAPQRARRGKFSKYAQKIFNRAEELRQN